MGHPDWLSQGRILQTMVQKVESASLEAGGAKGKEETFPRGLSSYCFIMRRQGTHSFVSQSQPQGLFGGISSTWTV